jgi:dsDNA-specific endonuclease/ATPase MutS2
VIREAREELRRMIREFKAQGRNDVHGLDRAIRQKEAGLERTLSGEAIESEAGRTPRIWRLGLEAETDFLPLARGKNRRLEERREKRFPAGSVEYEVPSAARELKIIGLRVEEALPLVDKAIDEALVGGLRELEVIHGAGTGRLRKAVRDYLREHDFVENFEPGGPGRGGDGVTIVAIGSGVRRSRSKARAVSE